MFSTHPATENRIAELEAIAAEMGSAPRRSALDPLSRN
jgi:predicted Zn-dependent protease